MHSKYLVLISFLLLFSCSTSKETLESKADPEQIKETGLSYLALGDSYTIGEAVEENERWPMLLAQKFKEHNVVFKTPNIIAKTGWRTDELLDAINQSDLEPGFDMVSLLIGVNNQYQGKEIKYYEQDFKILLNKALSLCKTKERGVFVVSIPDYGATPFGRTLKPNKIAEEINHYNKIAKRICESMEVEFINITDLSKLVAKNDKLSANDKLHPSGEMYKLWVDKAIHPSIEGRFK